VPVTDDNTRRLRRGGGWMIGKLHVAGMAAVAALAVGVTVSGVRGAQQATAPPAQGVPAQSPPAGRGSQAPDPPEKCGGRSATPEVACPEDVTKMLAALPAKAPAAAARARKILVLGRAAGYPHSSRPLAARMVEELGRKTGAWTTDVTYDVGGFTAGNLEQYDAIFLASTTGQFLDDPNDQAATDARRKALLDFVRGGKGLAGIHAATDSYHGGGAGAAGRGGGGAPLWPEFNRMIGGYFKHHWNYPTAITVKIDDPQSPINATFKGRSFNINDEVYTFNQDSWSRDNVHVLTSIDYSLMSDADRKKEGSPRTDQDYGLSWIRREGQGRVFYEALGHHESVYYDNPQILEHVLAGIQYALGDLKADDTPSGRTKR
jgi:type 1 glutamine amidotransferase